MYVYKVVLRLFWKEKPHAGLIYVGIEPTTITTLV